MKRLGIFIFIMLSATMAAAFSFSTSGSISAGQPWLNAHIVQIQTFLDALDNCTSTQALIGTSAGSVPGCGAISLTTLVSGTLPVANGGTGITSLGSGIATALGVATGTVGAPAILIASGAKALGITQILSTECDSSTATATGVASSDAVEFTPTADISLLTGYAPATTGALSIYVWPSTNTINFKVCNPTAATIGAGSTRGAVTLNWRVVR